MDKPEPTFEEVKEMWRKWLEHDKPLVKEDDNEVQK